jgi:hypothetical protein
MWTHNLASKEFKDGGASFGITVNMSNNGDDSDLLAIAVCGGNVYVVLV